MKIDSNLILVLVIAFCSVLIVSIAGLIILGAVHDGSTLSGIVSLLSGLLTSMITAMGPLAGAILGLHGAYNIMSSNGAGAGSGPTSDTGGAGATDTGSAT